ncbi:MAG TPA: CBS domain-containing protein [Candidatus Dormibacteraeota bacterium]|jgi:CBS domain-containing protein|nr:CBS domain-containing protein [Candidatus Dormibacteraeota bacterium]
MRVRRLRRPGRTARSLMTPGAITIGREASLTDAAVRMRAHRVGALAVTEDDHLVGIVSERDLLRAVAEGRDPARTQVGEAMTAGPRTIAPDRPLEEAVATMLELGVRHLPVVEGSRLVGFLSARDLLGLGGRPVDWRELAYEPW